MVMLSAVDGPPGLSVVAVHGPGGPSMTAACGPGRPIGGGDHRLCDRPNFTILAT